MVELLKLMSYNGVIMEQLFFYTDKGDKQFIDFVTSDHHFGHENIIRHANRELIDLEAMHRYMISQWNSVVEPHHTVLHLGDAALGNHEESVKNYGLCNGTKFLIPGNHDPISMLKSVNYRNAKRDFFESQFTVLDEHPLEMNLVMANGNSLTLYASHYPHDDGTDYQRKYRKLDLFTPNESHLIHGHTHSSEKLSVTDGVMSYHAGVDAHDYVPVSVKKIAEAFTSNGITF